MPDRGVARQHTDTLSGEGDQLPAMRARTPIGAATVYPAR
jgi:hypothetical protein